jgi:hypothetical protein
MEHEYDTLYSASQLRIYNPNMKSTSPIGVFMQREDSQLIFYIESRDTRSARGFDGEPPLLVILDVAAEEFQKYAADYTKWLNCDWDFNDPPEIDNYGRVVGSYHIDSNFNMESDNVQPVDLTVPPPSAPSTDNLIRVSVVIRHHEDGAESLVMDREDANHLIHQFRRRSQSVVSVPVVIGMNDINELQYGDMYIDVTQIQVITIARDDVEDI